VSRYSYGADTWSADIAQQGPHNGMQGSAKTLRVGGCAETSESIDGRFYDLTPRDEGDNRCGDVNKKGVDSKGSAIGHVMKFTGKIHGTAQRNSQEESHTGEGS
jgi:hypothetical protein